MELLLGNYIFFCILFLLLLILNKGKFNYRISAFYATFSFVVLLYLHCAVETDSVADLPSYKEGFEWLSKSDFIQFMFSYRTNEFVYHGLCKLLSFISDDFRLVLIVYNVILLCTHYYYFKKYSLCVPLSILMFMLLSYNQSIFVLRQYLAVSIILMSIPAIINKKLFAFLTVVTVAFFAHNSVIIWLPVYFLYNMKNTKLYIIVMVMSTIAFCFISQNLGVYLAMLDSGYSYYLADDSSAARNLTGIIISLVYFVLYMLVVRQEAFKPGINKLITTMLIISTVGCVFAPSVSLFGRMMKYFDMSLLWAVPLIFQKMSGTFSKFSFAIGVFVLQGYVSMAPLKEHYFKDFTTDLISFVYVLVLVVVVILFFKHYSKIQVQNE